MDLLRDLVEALGSFLGLESKVVDAIVLGLLIVGFAVLVFNLVWKGFGWVMLRRNKKLVNANLYPFFSGEDVERATRYYVHSRYQNVSPNEDDEPGRTYISAAKGKLLPLFLKDVFRRRNGQGRLYLILADAGMGKTTFMINLYLRYSNRLQLPWQAPKFEILLLPLGDEKALAKVAEVENKRETILLLDAFDEDPLATTDYQARLQEILKEANEFRYLVLTCRTQFFPSEKEEPSGSGYFSFGGGGEYRFQKVYLSTFSSRDVRRYLRKRFRFPRWGMRRKARKLVEKVPNLAVRPMLLANVEALVGKQSEIGNTGDIYRLMIDHWLQREAEKPNVIKEFGSSEAFKERLLKLSKDLAAYIYAHRKEHGLAVHKDTIRTWFANEEGAAKVFEWVDVVTDAKLRSQSLLARNSTGMYKFSHKSVFEYLMCQHVLEMEGKVEDFSFDGFDMMLQFYCEELMRRDRPWGVSFKMEGTLLRGRKSFFVVGGEEDGGVRNTRLMDGPGNPKRFLLEDWKWLRECEEVVWMSLANHGMFRWTLLPQLGEIKIPIRYNNEERCIMALSMILGKGETFRGWVDINGVGLTTSNQMFRAWIASLGGVADASHVLDSFVRSASEVGYPSVGPRKKFEKGPRTQLGLDYWSVYRALVLLNLISGRNILEGRFPGHHFNTRIGEAFRVVHIEVEPWLPPIVKNLVESGAKMSDNLSVEMSSKSEFFDESIELLWVVGIAIRHLDIDDLEILGNLLEGIVAELLPPILEEFPAAEFEEFRVGALKVPSNQLLRTAKLLRAFEYAYDTHRSKYNGSIMDSSSAFLSLVIKSISRNAWPCQVLLMKIVGMRFSNFALNVISEDQSLGKLEDLAWLLEYLSARDSEKITFEF